MACAINKLAVEINHGIVRGHDVLVQNRACASLRLRARARTLPGKSTMHVTDASNRPVRRIAARPLITAALALPDRRRAPDREMRDLPQGNGDGNTRASSPIPSWQTTPPAARPRVQ